MPDWSASMKQTYEYYIVDPRTWRDVKRLDTVTACSINRDSESDTLYSATIDITNTVGECYIRAYLVTEQNNIVEKHALGTVLVQTPSSNFDGKIRTVSLDAYSPLLELKENPPPIGYYVGMNLNVMDMAYRLARENMRAPVVKTDNSLTLPSHFVSNADDTWLSFISDLVANAKYRLDLDELGRVLFAPEQDTASLQPVWTYDDDNSSILYPDLNLDHDLYGIPNVVEVLYSVGSMCRYVKAVNDDPNSPISTVNRGREIKHRVTDPEVIGYLTNDQLQEYADRLLRSMSSLEYTVTYTHGYCPVRVGDCVRLNYKKAGLIDIKGKVISQTIKCEPGCPVTEKAVFTTNLWG